jgi:prophage tail gpP-like protein
MAEHAVNEDTFRLVVAGQECPIASNYNVAAGVFEVPAAFDMTIGHTGLLRDLIEGYAEFTPFELFVNDTRVMRGEIEELSSVGGDGTELKVQGFDLLNRLIRGEVPNDQTLTEVSFADITEMALKAVGLGDVSLVSSNLANRKAVTGSSKVTEIVHPAEDSTDATIAESVTKRTRTVHKSLVIETGTTWWDFLKQQYQRGGLFLWADSFGGFVLGQPNGKQPPIYRLVCRRTGNGEQGDVNFIGQPDFRRSANARYSEFHVMGRKGSGKDGRGQAFKRLIDDEMVALLNPNPADRADGGKIRKIKTYRDDKVKTPAQAAFLALRKMAESRRNALSIGYTIPGHTLPALSGGGRLVVQPETVIHIVDEERGIDGPMYIDDVKYSRQPMSRARISVMRPEDLLFGDEDLLASPPVQKNGLVRIGRTEVFHPVWIKDPNWGGLPVRAWQSADGKILKTDPNPAYNPNLGAGRRGG